MGCKKSIFRTKNLIVHSNISYSYTMVKEFKTKNNCIVTGESLIPKLL